MMKIFYEGQWGEHIEMSARNAIALADRHNRKVRMRFNDVALTVNKRLSVKHVVRTWQRMVDARQLRHHNSPAGRAAKAKRAAEIAAKQSQLDSLMMKFPASKEDVAAWLAAWVPLSDDVGVDRRGDVVVESLKSLGFVSGQHVGASEFKDDTASRMMRIEYIAGQVISMLESVGCVHPMIGKWAAESAA
jgi:hypothetical protein